MTWVFPPFEIDEPPSEEPSAFRHYWELERRAETEAIPWRRYRRLRGLGYTKAGARWMINQADEAEPPTDERRTATSSPYRRIALCLSEATPTFDDLRRSGAAAVDKRRVKAVRELHTWFLKLQSEQRAVEDEVIRSAELLRAWPKDAIETALQQRRAHWIALGAPPDFDRALRDFFERAARAIFSTPDPATAMRIFWEGAPLRGRKKEDNAERDLDLAIAVQERVYAGLSQEKAIHAIAETYNLFSAHYPQDLLLVEVGRHQSCGVAGVRKELVSRRAPGPITDDRGRPPLRLVVNYRQISADGFSDKP